MSRRKNALIATTFSYVQWVLGIVTALYVTRLLIHVLGRDVYGMWLATGAVFAYAALSDLGILAVMPWLFAEADGEKSPEKVRALLVNGLATGVVGGFAYAALALVLWLVLPNLLHFSEADRGILRGPVLAMAALTAVSYPLRLLTALRTGLQDFAFLGVVSLLQTVLTLAVTAGLTLAGCGLYGIALGSSIAVIVTGLASLLRTVSQNPELVRDLPRPGWPVVRKIVVSGAGVWFGVIGWQLAFGSDSVVIASLGHRDLVPVFTITSRLGLTLMQMAWTLPDSASVGLAQLNAEGNKGRVSEVVAALLRLQVLAAGGVACVVLAANFGFVGAWVGAEFYGGARLNAMLAVDVIVLSLSHGLIVPAGVLGQRVKAGSVQLVNGALHIGLALALGREWGLVGVAAGTALSTLLTSVPICARLLEGVTLLTVPRMVREILLPWSLRALPCCLLAAAVGWACMRSAALAGLGRYGALVATGLVTSVVGLIYLIGMRSLMRDLPFGPRMRGILSALRLV